MQRTAVEVTARRVPSVAVVGAALAVLAVRATGRWGVRAHATAGARIEDPGCGSGAIAPLALWAVSAAVAQRTVKDTVVVLACRACGARVCCSVEDLRCRARQARARVSAQVLELACGALAFKALVRCLASPGGAKALAGGACLARRRAKVRWR